MKWIYNPSVWLVVVGALIVIGIMVFSMQPFKKAELKPFKPIVAGTVAEISAEHIIDFITNPDPDTVRSLLIINNDNYKNKAAELYSIIDKPEQYEKMFSRSADNLATSEDLGGILLSRHDNNRLEIYSLIATEEGEPIITSEKRFNSKRQAADNIRVFYNRIQSYFENYSVLIISGPPIKVEIVSDQQNTIENTGETQLETHTEPPDLLYHPSSISVDRYTRHGKQTIQNVSSLNNAVQPTLTDHILYDENSRFQTPRHYLPTMNPIFNNHIRTNDALLNLGGVSTNSLEIVSDEEKDF